MTRTSRTALLGASVLLGLSIVAGAFLWLNPHRGPKPESFVAALCAGVGLLLFAFGASNAPVIPPEPLRAAEEPPRGSAPAPARWHRVVLSHLHPDRVAVRAPERCAACGQPELDWVVPVASHERNAGLGLVLGLGGGVVGELAAHALVETRQVVVHACDPCYRLGARREASRVVLLTAVVVPTLVGSIPALLGRLPWALLGGGGVALAVAAVAVHGWRFGRRRARATSLVAGVGVRGRLRRASWFTLSETDVRWRVVLDTCDPTWARDVAALNADTCDAELDLDAAEAHAAELRSAGLRFG
jgi:hypothetical protein